MINRIHRRTDRKKHEPFRQNGKEPFGFTNQSMAGKLTLLN